MPDRLQVANQAKVVQARVVRDPAANQARVVRDPAANQAKEARASPTKVVPLTTTKWISSMLVMITTVTMGQVVNPERIQEKQTRVEREAQASRQKVPQVRAERVLKPAAENMDMASQGRDPSQQKHHLRVERAPGNQARERVIGSIMTVVVGTITEIWRRIIVL